MPSLKIRSRHLVGREILKRDKEIHWLLHNSRQITWGTKDLSDKFGIYRNEARESIYRLRTRHKFIIPNRATFNGPYYLATRVDIPTEWLVEDEARRQAYRNTVDYNSDIQSIGIQTILQNRGLLVNFNALV